MRSGCNLAAFLWLYLAANWLLMIYAHDFPNLHNGWKVAANGRLLQWNILISRYTCTFELWPLQLKLQPFYSHLSGLLQCPGKLGCKLQAEWLQIAGSMAAYKTLAVLVRRLLESVTPKVRHWKLHRSASKSSFKLPCCINTKTNHF